MDDATFPALYRSADTAAGKRQTDYLRLIRTEYALLLLAAVFSATPIKASWFYAVCAFVFFVSIIVLMTRSMQKPEQDWYRARALAESVKTIAWRYMMGAAPFGVGTDAQARIEFGDHLKQLFDANRNAVQRLTPDGSAEDQITTQMETVRATALADRRALYLAHRVRDQRNWYAARADTNRKSASQWVSITVAAYILAGGLCLARIQLPDWPVWPIEPLIVFASCAVGWMQIKKFNELAVAYTVTAHEIGLLGPRLEAASNEVELSNAINEAELAFSREHTFWIARQTT